MTEFTWNTEPGDIKGQLRDAAEKMENPPLVKWPVPLRVHPKRYDWLVLHGYIDADSKPTAKMRDWVGDIFSEVVKAGSE